MRFSGISNGFGNDRTIAFVDVQDRCLSTEPLLAVHRRLDSSCEAIAPHLSSYKTSSLAGADNTPARSSLGIESLRVVLTQRILYREAELWPDVGHLAY